MKLLVTALVLLSSTAFAQYPDATEVLTSILPVGEYSGSYNGKACKVSVKPSNAGIVVTAMNAGLIRTREVARGSGYRLQRGSAFLSTEIFSEDEGPRENILRTNPQNNPNQMYVVVADFFRRSDRQNLELAVECVVNL